MDKQQLIKAASNFVESSEYNYISKEIAISENVVGMKIFEAPIFAFGSAEDEYFKLLKEPEVIGEHFLAPKEWLPQCKTVISFFLPFSEAVKKGNRRDMVWPSEGWLHGRIEGQLLLNKLSTYLKSELVNSGYNSLVPSLDERFWSKAAFNNNLEHKEAEFTSNWSERHVAFVCGLGTFGISKGIITSKGMSGRVGSILTELYLPPTEREYESIYEYCSNCGVCAIKCPANAITIDKGKNHSICSNFLDTTCEKYKPRYGCGKCQTGVPCEGRIPNQQKIKLG